MRSKKDFEMTANIARLAIFIICVIFYFSQIPGSNSSVVKVSATEKYFSPAVYKKINTFVQKAETEGGIVLEGNEKIIKKEDLINYFKEIDAVYAQFAPFYNYKHLFNLGMVAITYILVIIFLTRGVYHPMMSMVFALIDFILCILFIFWTGGINSPFVFLLILPIVHVSFQFGPYAGAGLSVFTLAVIYVFSNFVGFMGTDAIKNFASTFRTIIPLGSVMIVTGSLIGYISNLANPVGTADHIVVDSKEKRLEEVTRKCQEQMKIIQKYQTMEGEFRKRQREIFDITEIIKEIVSEVNIKKLFPLIMNKAAEQCEARVGAILMKTKMGTLKVEERYSLSSISERIFSTRVGEGVTGMVALKGSPVIMSKEEGDEKFNFFARCPERIQNTICVPIEHRGEIDGVIILCNKLTGNAFTEHDILSLTNIAGMAATALANARLFNKLRAMNSELENANTELEKKNLQLSNSIESTIKTLAEALEAKDNYTRGHTDRVARYAVALASHMVQIGKLKAEELERIRRGSQLHDIGKIGIPDRVLLKPEGLTDDEFEIIKTHVTEGAKIIEKVDTLSELMDVVKYHHEKYDGTGYPCGLKGNQIPLSARIVAVADTYDAMTTDRPYRKGFPPEVALEKMSKFAAKQFGMDIFIEFEKVARKTSFFRS
jgi:putative nucleotidyltransferase with HDIG domain